MDFINSAVVGVSAYLAGRATEAFAHWRRMDIPESKDPRDPSSSLCRGGLDDPRVEGNRDRTGIAVRIPLDPSPTPSRSSDSPLGQIDTTIRHQQGRQQKASQPKSL